MDRVFSDAVQYAPYPERRLFHAASRTLYEPVLGILQGPFGVLSCGSRSSLSKLTFVEFLRRAHTKKPELFMAPANVRC